MSLSFGYAALPDEHLQHGTGSMMADLAEQLYDKIKRLNESLWERRTTRPAVDEWLENFSGSYVSQTKSASMPFISCQNSFSLGTMR